MIRWYKKASGEVVLQMCVKPDAAPTHKPWADFWIDVPTEVEKNGVDPTGLLCRGCGKRISSSHKCPGPFADVKVKPTPRKAREWWLDPNSKGQDTIIAWNRPTHATKEWIHVREVLDDGVEPQENMR